MMKTKEAAGNAKPSRFSLTSCLNKPLPEPACGIIKFRNAVDGTAKWSQYHPVILGDIDGIRAVCTLPQFYFDGCTSKYVFIEDMDNGRKFIISLSQNAFRELDFDVRFGGSHPSIIGMVSASGRPVGLVEERIPNPSASSLAPSPSPLKVSGGLLEFHEDGRITASGSSTVYGMGPNDLVANVLTKLSTALKEEAEKVYSFLEKINQ